MKFHHAGKYNGDENSLPQREHPANSVPFKEPKNMTAMAVIMNLMAIIITVISIIIVEILAEEDAYKTNEYLYGIIASLITLIPHEFLHAVCFKSDVYMYTNLSKGMLFVYGTEDMSKARFIFMSFLPNIVFGFIPFVIFLIRPELIFFGVLGAFCIGSGAGDYLNIFNCITQVPKNSKVYQCGIHTYWYK